MTTSEQTCTLSDRTCAPCSGGIPALNRDAASAHLAQLTSDWSLDADAKTLSRHFKFKGFAKATYLANLCAWLADQQGHHPDIRFGWGYVDVQLTTHEIDGLSENDFIWAAKLDQLVV
ncbi:4a-hydroxytetrahydrobiopterin dehydratase [Ruegeria faecimaris]|uniref:Putative pterin-4-alpha-carbinolamine dehydratase n=1 Tax=Ruegeria faecimaris TaxID=686389 RepID=A0A521C8W1_9RHOB|nr:4a-hydroxytetrahydrobiopterin dehydratase [Ruegeria faecimaris]SMO55932.1 4a-hydroxytetrahydrobiopterin dehydratase [Ruegeria faecimaris]